MNSTQRKFLLDKVTERTKTRISHLREAIPDALSLDVYMLNKVMSNDFEIKSTEELKVLVLEKALKAGQSRQYREDWLGSPWGNSSKGVVFKLEEFFVIPEPYLQMKRERQEKIAKIEEEINSLQIQLETLEIRIMVASDKVLQRLVNEVDDMGDLSLIDTRIKLLE